MISDFIMYRIDTLNENLERLDYELGELIDNPSLNQANKLCTISNQINDNVRHVRRGIIHGDTDD